MKIILTSILLLAYQALGLCRGVDEAQIQAIRSIINTERKKVGSAPHLFVYLYSNGGAIEFIPNTIVRNTIVLLSYTSPSDKVKIKYWLLPNTTSNIAEYEKSLFDAIKVDFSHYQAGKMFIDKTKVAQIFRSDFENSIIEYKAPEYGFVGQGPLTWFGISVNNKIGIGRGELLPESLDLIIRPCMEEVLQAIWKHQHPSEGRK